MNLESIAILWSPRQKCFHREPLGETIKAGMKAFLHNAEVDFILVAICNTKEESDTWLTYFRKMRAESVIPLSQNLTNISHAAGTVPNCEGCAEERENPPLMELPDILEIDHTITRAAPPSELVEVRSVDILCDSGGVLTIASRRGDFQKGWMYRLSQLTPEATQSKPMEAQALAANLELENAKSKLKQWERMFGPVLDFVQSNGDALGVRVGDSIDKCILDMLVKKVARPAPDNSQEGKL